MPRGGRREGAGGRHKWKHGETKTIRVPIELADEILEFAHKLDDGVIIEHETQSKVLNLSGVSIRVCNGKSAVYLEDLAKAGYEILPERLGNIFKAILNNGLRG
ncbi:MAG: hypothetical protein AAGA02_14570 [Bacteroidota bacterium]